MRKSLLMSAAALGLALPAMAQNTSNSQTPPSPNAGVSAPVSPNNLPPGASTATGTASQAGGQGDMTGMQPMRHPRSAGMAHNRTARHGQGQNTAAMSDTGARPGHEPGVGNSEPMSDRASNIDRGDTRSDIAPRLPNPDASANTPEAYLAAADRALARHQTGAAQEALERAETRLLDRSVPQGQGNTPDQDPRIQQVNSALQALGNRNYVGARQSIQQAMNMGGGSGMGQGGMNQGGMGQPGMAPPPGAGLPR